jgi:hypothetical protein
MKVMGFKGQHDIRTPKPEHHRALEEPSGTLQERGDYSVSVVESSLYSKSKMHPNWTMGIAVAAGAALTPATALRRR